MNTNINPIPTAAGVIFNNYSSYQELLLSNSSSVTPTTFLLAPNRNNNNNILQPQQLKPSPIITAYSHSHAMNSQMHLQQQQQRQQLNSAVTSIRGKPVPHMVSSPLQQHNNNQLQTTNNNVVNSINGWLLQNNNTLPPPPPNILSSPSPATRLNFAPANPTPQTPQWKISSTTTTPLAFNSISGSGGGGYYRSTPGGASSATPGYSISGSGGAGDRAGKGLRHFSMKVCEKVHRKGVTTYNEVADELVAEFALNSFFSNAALSANSPHGHHDAETALSNLAYDHKNIRRRVYDALNVLMAMNIISKEKKEIRWIGLPTNPTQECANLTKEKEKRMERIKDKQAELNKLLLKQIALKNLIERGRKEHGNCCYEEIHSNKMNISQPDIHGISAFQSVTPTPTADRHELKNHASAFPEPSLFLPFILISTDKSTVIDCSISNDRCEYYFNFNNDFEVIDDYQIMKKLNLTMGFDDSIVGFNNTTLLPSSDGHNNDIDPASLLPNSSKFHKVDENTLAKALTMVPKVMHPYIRKLGGYDADLPEGNVTRTDGTRVISQFVSNSGNLIRDNNNNNNNFYPQNIISTYMPLLKTPKRENSMINLTTTPSSALPKPTFNTLNPITTAVISNNATLHSCVANHHYNTTKDDDTTINAKKTMKKDDIDLLSKYNLINKIVVDENQKLNYYSPSAASAALFNTIQQHQLLQQQPIIASTTAQRLLKNEFLNFDHNSGHEKRVITTNPPPPSSPAISLATLQFKNLLSTRAAALLGYGNRPQPHAHLPKNGLFYDNDDDDGDVGRGKVKTAGTSSNIPENFENLTSTIKNKPDCLLTKKMMIVDHSSLHLGQQTQGNRKNKTGIPANHKSNSIFTSNKGREEMEASSTSTSEIFSSEDSLGASSSQSQNSAASYGYGGV